MEALLLATRERLRAGLPLPPRECDVMPDGRPPAYAGEVFVAVHPGGISTAAGVDDDLALDEVYALVVTLTLRAAWLPRDRQGEFQTALAGAGLYARAERARALLHMSYAVLDLANFGQAYSIGSGENGFHHPLVSEGCGPPEEKGPEWFDAVSEGAGGDPPAGWALAWRFGGARRRQVIEEQG
jgi:hypothetical protein